MSNIEVLKQAIEALEENVVWFSTDTMIGRSLKEKTNKAIASLNQAIAELESQEPFTYYRHYDGSTQEWPDELTIPLYTHPPQRTWVGLTDDEQQQAYEQWQNDGWGVFYNSIEAKLKQKNGFAEEKNT